MSMNRLAAFAQDRPGSGLYEQRGHDLRNRHGRGIILLESWARVLGLARDGLLATYDTPLFQTRASVSRILSGYQTWKRCT